MHPMQSESSSDRATFDESCTVARAVAVNKVTRMKRMRAAFIVHDSVGLLWGFGSGLEVL
jgi:hypothetical protein